MEEAVIIEGRLSVTEGERSRGGWIKNLTSLQLNLCFIQVDFGFVSATTFYIHLWNKLFLFLTWQNSLHPAVSSCYSFEGLGLADLQTPDFHNWGVSASAASALRQRPYHRPLLGPWRACPPGPGSGQPTQSKNSRWRQNWLQSGGQGHEGRGRWKLGHLWQHTSSRVNR